MSMSHPPPEVEETTDARPAWVRRFLSARRQVHRSRGGMVTWKVVVAAVGTTVVLAGIVMLVTPGPGWAAILVGLAILSTEFDWAARMRHAVARRLATGAHRVRSWPRWLAVLVAAAATVVVLAAGYATLVLFGVPNWLPAGVRDPVRSWPLVRD